MNTFAGFGIRESSPPVRDLWLRDVTAANVAHTSSVSPADSKNGSESDRHGRDRDDANDHDEQRHRS
jgi:hypothetical protein